LAGELFDICRKKPLCLFILSPPLSRQHPLVEKKLATKGKEKAPR
jgi:hypothetical protein